MRDDAAIKLAAKLADDFDADTFSEPSGQSESEAATTLNALVGRAGEKQHTRLDQAD